MVVYIHCNVSFVVPSVLCSIVNNKVHSLQELLFVISSQSAIFDIPIYIPQNYDTYCTVLMTNNMK